MKPHKQVAVVFNKYGARIVVNDFSAYKNSKDMVVNPDLKAVKGLPPHYWKLVDGKVVPKNFIEKIVVDNLHKESKFDSQKMQVFKKRPSLLYALVFLTIGAAIPELFRLVLLYLPK